MLANMQFFLCDVLHRHSIGHCPALNSESILLQEGKPRPHQLIHAVAVQPETVCQCRLGHSLAGARVRVQDHAAHSVLEAGHCSTAAALVEVGALESPSWLPGLKLSVLSACAALLDSGTDHLVSQPGWTDVISCLVLILCMQSIRQDSCQCRLRTADRWSALPAPLQQVLQGSPILSVSLHMSTACQNCW